MAVELSALADGTLRALTGRPGAADIVPRELVHYVVGDSALGDDVITEWISACHAHDRGEGELTLTTIMQPASGDLPGYRKVIEWHAIRAAWADQDTQPNSFRLSSTYATPGRPQRSAEQATSWWREHQSRLTAMLDAAYEQSWSDLVLQLAEPMWSLYRFTGDHDNELDTQTLSLAAAAGLPEEQRHRYLAVCHSRAAYALSSLQRHSTALLEADRALEHARRTDEPRIVSIALSIRGRALQFAGQPLSAMDSYQQALTLAEQLDDPRSLALRHRRMGEILVELDDLVGAISHYETAAELMATAGDPVGGARVKTFLGRALLAAGEPAAAYAAVRPTLTTLGSSGCDFWAADANEVAGAAAEHADPSGEASRRYYDTAIELFQRGGEPARAERVRQRLAGLGLR